MLILVLDPLDWDTCCQGCRYDPEPPERLPRSAKFCPWCGGKFTHVAAPVYSSAVTKMHAHDERPDLLPADMTNIGPIPRRPRS